MENVKENGSTKMKSRRGTFDYRSLALQAGAVVAQGALFGLGSSIASRLTNPKIVSKFDVLTGSKDDVFPIKGSKTAIN